MGPEEKLRDLVSRLERLCPQPCRDHPGNCSIDDARRVIEKLLEPASDVQCDANMEVYGNMSEIWSIYRGEEDGDIDRFIGYEMPRRSIAAARLKLIEEIFSA